MSGRRHVPFKTLLACCAALFCAYVMAEPSLASLMTQFEAAYEVPEHLVAGSAALAQLERRQMHKLLPTFSLRQRAQYADFQRLIFDVDLDLIIPLFRATSERESQLLRTRSVGHHAEERWGAMEARANFQRDLLSTALLRELIRDAAAVLADFREEGLLPVLTTTKLLRLSPGQRELLALEREVRELQRFASGHLAELEQRVQAALHVTGPQALPPFQVLLEEVGARVSDHATCLSAAPARHQALQRGQEKLQAESLAAVLPVEIDLRATASRSYGDSYGNDSASVALHVRVPLPDGWPLDGELNFSAGSFGVSQQLQLSWPAHLGVGAQDDSGRAIAAQHLADEVEAVEAALLAQRSQLAQARREVEASELQLLWLVHDVYGGGVDDLAIARAIAAAPFPDVVSELHATQLRSQLNFARLAEAEKVLALRLACGEP